ncbi:MAG: cytochrome c [Deltaproteobacteria bacterium]|nr:cytochrome c [Deltaproteobacteria bacterium]
MKHLITNGAFAWGIALIAVSRVVSAGEPDQGRELYRKYCASCHGAQGTGDGPVSPHLKVKPTDLTRLKKENRGIYPLGKVMSSIDGTRDVRGHGDAKMPVWGEVFEKEAEAKRYPTLTSLLKVKVIAEYISTLQR